MILQVFVTQLGGSACFTCLVVRVSSWWSCLLLQCVFTDCCVLDVAGNELEIAACQQLQQSNKRHHTVRVFLHEALPKFFFLFFLVYYTTNQSLWMMGMYVDLKLIHEIALLWDVQRNSTYVLMNTDIQFIWNKNHVIVISLPFTWNQDEKNQMMTTNVWVKQVCHNES